MPLIVIKRKERSLAKECPECEYFVEMKDDPKQYPSTVAVICNAPQNEYMGCFEYMWLMVKGRYHERIRKPKPSEKPIIPEKTQDFNDILKRLKHIGTVRKVYK